MHLLNELLYDKLPYDMVYKIMIVNDNVSASAGAEYS